MVSGGSVLQLVRTVELGVWIHPASATEVKAISPTIKVAGPVSLLPADSEVEIRTCADEGLRRPDLRGKWDGLLFAASSGSLFVHLAFLSLSNPRDKINLK